MSADDHLAIEMQAARRGVGCARGVRGAKRKAVDIGAIEWRNVDRRLDVLRQDPAERRRKRDRLAGQRGEINVPAEARTRLRGRDHFQELLLASGTPDRRDQFVLGRARCETRSHGQGLTMTSLCAGYPSLSGLTRIHPLACASAESET